MSNLNHKADSEAICLYCDILISQGSCVNKRNSRTVSNGVYFESIPLIPTSYIIALAITICGCGNQASDREQVSIGQGSQPIDYTQNADNKKKCKETYSILLKDATCSFKLPAAWCNGTDRRNCVSYDQSDMATNSTLKNQMNYVCSTVLNKSIFHLQAGQASWAEEDDSVFSGPFVRVYTMNSTINNIINKLCSTGLLDDINGHLKSEVELYEYHPDDHQWGQLLLTYETNHGDYIARSCVDLRMFRVGDEDSVVFVFLYQDIYHAANDLYQLLSSVRIIQNKKTLNRATSD